VPSKGSTVAEARPPWRPTSIFLPSLPIRTDTMPVAVGTDVGNAYLKARWRPESGSWLAREMIGLRLATALGLEAPACCVYDLGAAETPEDRDGNSAEDGPALLVEAIEWILWDGTAATLSSISNKADVAGLVVLDTWLRNTDRYRPTLAGQPLPDPKLGNLDNVALSTDAQRQRRFRLRAVDFNRTLHPQTTLDAGHMGPQAVSDEGIYGLFPAFGAVIKKQHLQEFINRLDGIPSEQIRTVVGEVPELWWPNAEAKAATEGFLMQRREMVRSRMESLMAPLLGWLDV
jgi:hypothetical protein